MLIECPECTQQVSTAALSCPHCGYPIKLNDKDQRPENTFETADIKANHILSTTLQKLKYPVKVCSKQIGKICCLLIVMFFVACLYRIIVIEMPFWRYGSNPIKSPSLIIIAAAFTGIPWLVFLSLVRRLYGIRVNRIFYPIFVLGAVSGLIIDFVSFADYYHLKYISAATFSAAIVVKLFVLVMIAITQYRKPVKSAACPCT